MKASTFTLLSFCILGIVLPSYGQTSDSSAYFPCAVGNKWQWVSESDTSKTTNEITRDSTGRDGTTFLFYNGGNVPSYSIDTVHRVYQFLNITDTLGHVSLGPAILLYKLDAQAGDSFYTNNNTALIKVSIHSSTVFGHPVSIKQFTWYAYPAGYWFLSSLLAWGFGQIQSEGPFPGGVVGCKIDGINYGSLLSVRESDLPLPKALQLEQNYPNPFNPSTVIRYGLPLTGRVTLRVYNLLGQLVETLVDGIEPAGYRDVSWSPHLASGMYIYRLESGRLSQTKLLLFLR